MKKLTPLFFIILSLGVIFGCKTKKLTSSYMNKNITIDGDIADWGNLPVYHMKDLSVFVSLCNDEENLYVMLSFKNKQLIQSFQMTGITLWLDNSGKKQKEFGMRLTGNMPFKREFERDGRRGNNINRGERPPERPTEGKRPDFPMGNKVEGLSFVTGDGELIPPVKGKSMPEGEYKTSMGNQILEFKIPIKKNDENIIGLNVLKKGVVSIGFEAGRSMQAGSRGMGPPGGGDMGGKGERMDGGRMGGSRMGGPGGKMGGMDRGAKERVGKQEMWFKVRLADRSNGSEGDK